MANYELLGPIESYARVAVEPSRRRRPNVVRVDEQVSERLSINGMSDIEGEVVRRAILTVATKGVRFANGEKLRHIEDALASGEFHSYAQLSRLGTLSLIDGQVLGGLAEPTITSLARNIGAVPNEIPGELRTVIGTPREPHLLELARTAKRMSQEAHEEVTSQLTSVNGLTVQRIQSGLDEHLVAGRVVAAIEFALPPLQTS